MLEAWAWLRAHGDPPQWGYYRQGQTMEYLYFKWLRLTHPHIKPRWYTRALWAAKIYEQHEGDLSSEARSEISSVFARKKWTENPGLDETLLQDALDNLPPFEPPFDKARRLTMMLREIRDRDSWRTARWFRKMGMLNNPSDLVGIKNAWGMTLNQRQVTDMLDYDLEAHYPKEQA